MTTDTLVMDERVVWDSKRLKEIDEAKKRILDHKKAGYEIVLADGSPMKTFNPRYEEVIIRARKVGKKNVLKILNELGDERIIWEKEDGREAKEAKKKFVDYIKKGYKAYSVDARGKKNMRIDEFDVDAEEILMVPPTAKG